MEFQIVKPKVLTEKAKSYRVRLDWEHGDGEGVTSTWSGYFKKDQDEWVLEEFVRVLNELEDITRDYYEENDGYRKFFVSSEYEFSKEEEILYKPFINVDGEGDLVYEGTALLSGYQIYYYDANYEEYIVKVVY